MGGNSGNKDGCFPGNHLPDSLDQWPSFDEVLSKGILLRKATSWGNTDTFILCTRNGTKYLLKTFARQPLLIRVLLGRISIRHEYKVLNFLEHKGFRYAPRAYRLLNQDSILMEYITGDGPLLKKEKYAPEDCPPIEFFQTLIALMRNLHEMGVCHGDFRRANILRYSRNEPVLIDWATAVLKYPRGKKLFLYRYLYKVMKRSDLYSLAALVESYYPELLDAELQQHLVDLPWFLRLGRFLRQKFYRHFIKQWFGRKNNSSNIS